MKLLLATRNPGKVREIRPIFRDAGIELVGLDEAGIPRSSEEEELERGASFAENALAKARYFHALSGMPTLAEDSGLEVDALDGAPGVRTKRFAPTEMQEERGVDMANNLYLLERLQAVPDEERSARFVCAAALVLDGEERVFDGVVEGRILREMRGEGGFGYDPLFWLPERGRTTAELAAHEKNEISHRGRAVRKARDWLLEHHESAPKERPGAA